MNPDEAGRTEGLKSPGAPRPRMRRLVVGAVALLALALPVRADPGDSPEDPIELVWHADAYAFAAGEIAAGDLVWYRLAPFGDHAIWFQLDVFDAPLEVVVLDEDGTAIFAKDGEAFSVLFGTLLVDGPVRFGIRAPVGDSAFQLYAEHGPASDYTVVSHTVTPVLEDGLDRGLRHIEVQVRVPAVGGDRTLRITQRSTAHFEDLAVVAFSPSGTQEIRTLHVEWRPLVAVGEVPLLAALDASDYDPVWEDDRITAMTTFVAGADGRGAAITGL